MLVSADDGGGYDDDKTLFTQIIINFNDDWNSFLFKFVVLKNKKHWFAKK